MERLLAYIENYIRYLSRQDIQVTIHFKAKVIESFPEPIFSRLLGVNCHTNPYCIRVKGEAWEKCLRCQRMVIQKCKQETAFSGSCHAGVREYIQAVYAEGVPAGYVAASGYRGKCPDARRMEQWERSLKAEAPEETLSVLLPPLAAMVEQLLQVPRGGSSNEYNLIRRYVNDHYRDVTLDDLCRVFARSRSHISHLFNENSNMTLRAYCNLRKLEDARQLLLQTDMSVTQIAFETGFCDTSYFISLFRNHFGKTPYQMRR